MKKLSILVSIILLLSIGVGSYEVLNRNPSELKLSDDKLYGKLTAFKPIYSDGKIDHFLLTVLKNDFSTTQPIEVVVYIPPGYSEKQLYDIVFGNYCIEFTLDPNRYNQVSYRIATDILLLEKNCE
jgi:hypothetical protein